MTPPVALERERMHAGDVLGRWLSPAVGFVARLRQARTFHPDGVMASGRVSPVPASPWAELAARLSGPLLARCSGALWRQGHDAFDVLGIALRFRAQGSAADVAPGPTDQDLLFATIVSPFTMLAAPFTTHWSDFLHNRFYAVAPFQVAGAGRLKFRLSPTSHAPHPGASRTDRLVAAIRAGQAHWLLEARPVFRWPWRPVARVTFDAQLALDQAALRFDPFRDGRGISPRGLVHALRPATYAASQAER